MPARGIRLCPLGSPLRRALRRALSGGSMPPSTHRKRGRISATALSAEGDRRFRIAGGCDGSAESCGRRGVERSEGDARIQVRLVEESSGDAVGLWRGELVIAAGGREI